MRITPDVIQNARQYTNRATTDRELQLRELKIPAIENLGITLNQFDCIDLTDNFIRKLENFPLLPRLKCLLLSNNRISKIVPKLEESIPNLERLILTNNFLNELGDIDNLSSFTNLKVICLLGNPLSQRNFYRSYIIYRLPHLKLLDFQKVKPQERKDAQELFSGPEGQILVEKIGIISQGTMDEEMITEIQQGMLARNKRMAMDDDDVEIDAKAQESIKRINNMIKSGYVPGSKGKRKHEEDLIENVNISDHHRSNETRNT